MRLQFLSRFASSHLEHYRRNGILWISIIFFQLIKKLKNVKLTLIFLLSPKHAWTNVLGNLLGLQTSLDILLPAVTESPFVGGCVKISVGNLHSAPALTSLATNRIKYLLGRIWSLVSGQKNNKKSPKISEKSNDRTRCFHDGNFVAA